MLRAAGRLAEVRFKPLPRRAAAAGAYSACAGRSPTVEAARLPIGSNKLLLRTLRWCSRAAGLRLGDAPDSLCVPLPLVTQVREGQALALALQVRA